MRRNTGSRLLIVALFFLGIPSIYSQTRSDALHKAVAFSGNLADLTGASISGATVSLEASGHSILWTTADLTGHFVIEAHEGDYTLRVISRGFKKYEQSIHLTEGAISKDLVLQLADGFVAVCVGPIPHQIETRDPSLTATLPLNPLPPLKLHERIAR